MTKFSYNKSQLEIGAATARAVSSDLSTLSSTIESGLKNIINAGTNNKVDLYGTISTDGIASSMSDFNTKLERVCALAIKQGELADRYNEGGYSPDVYEQFAKSQNNLVYPNIATRTLATVGMGVAKFGEGFLSFFENVGDCAISLGAGIFGLLGSDDISQKMKDFASRDLSTELIENNAAFEWINEASYFDKDSAFASVCKFAGEATAAAVTSSAVCRVGTKVMESSRGLEAATEFGKKAGKITDKTLDYGGDIGDKLTEEMGKGKSFKDSVLTTAATLAVDKTLGKAADVGIHKPVSKVVVGKLQDTVVEKGYQTVKDKASDVFNEKVVDHVEDIGVKEIKKNTTGKAKGEIIDDLPIDEIGTPEEEEVRDYNIEYEE